MAEFGNNFKQAREAKDLTIEQIAAETRISSRFLKAIEDDDFGALPGGIVGRGFVRTYASSVGLDADQAVAAFEGLSQYREPPLAEGFRISSTSSTKNRNFYPLAAGLLVLLVIGFYVFTRETAPVTTMPPVQPAATVPAAPPPPPAPAPADNPAPTTAEAAAPDTSTTPPPAQGTATAPVNAPVNAPASSGSGNYILEVEATADSWINVTADGTLVTQRVLHAGETRRFSADNSLVLFTGNAGGLQIKINGHSQPPLGDSGRVRTLTINPETIKAFVP